MSSILYSNFLANTRTGDSGSPWLNKLIYSLAPEKKNGVFAKVSNPKHLLCFFESDNVACVFFSLLFITKNVAHSQS